MRTYDAERFDPPAPLAMVTVKSERPGIVLDNVPMLLDTGADISLLPRSQVTALVSNEAKQYELQAFDGTRAQRRL